MTLLGTGIGGLTSTITQAAKNHWDWSKVNWGVVVSDAVFGAISGALAATGLGAFGSAIAGGFDARNLGGKFTSAATKYLTAKSIKKQARYIAQKTMVKKEIIKGITGFITSTIGASGISYGLDYLGAY